MTTPRATYRLQFRNGMTFERAAALAPYLSKLGISHLYASPIFAATAGSAHGYDVTDHNRLDPALGGEAGFAVLTDALRNAGLELILDIVPNHMAAHTGNPWWRSIVEWGRESPYAGHFDVDWSERLTLPMLGRPFAEAVVAGEIGLALDPDCGALALSCADAIVPLTPPSYDLVLERIEAALASTMAALARRATAGTAEHLHDGIKALIRDGAGLSALQQELRRLAGDARLLAALHDAQPWRLIRWRDARKHLSYRRFFEVTGLAGVRVEDPPVFDDVHRLTLDLVRDGHATGLRVDHVDGLADPGGYLQRLRAAAGTGTYLVVEKILAGDEAPPGDWPVAGTTGYEFIAALSGVLVDHNQAAALDAGYFDCLGEAVDFEAERRRAKTLILRRNLETELTALTDLALATCDDAALDRGAVEDAIAELVIAFPVYRTYGTAAGQSARDRRLIEAVAPAVRGQQEVDSAALDFIVRLLLLDGDMGEMPEACAFVTRFQQTTGPVMAKAVEDTLFYRCNRLIALNEVGDDPQERGGSVAGFHARMQEWARRQPQGLLATTTHDTKRAEDARARLYAISEAPAAWAEGVRRWRDMQRGMVRGLDDGPAPEPEMEWLLYQALAGVWPLDAPVGNGIEGLQKRFYGYLEKAMREAKSRSDWAAINTPYEAAVQDYARRLLDPRNRRFLDDFAQTLEPFSRAGVLNSLTQVTLKLCVPGVPDVYQGTEGWDFSLVDPDNRRPVDFGHLTRQLDALEDRALDDLLADWRSGAVKQFLMSRGLAARAARPDLFTHGRYEPLEVTGERQDHVIAFLRRSGDGVAIVAVPRLTLCLLRDAEGLTISESQWGDTAVSLPADLHRTSLKDAFSGEPVTGAACLEAARLFSRFPTCLLLGD